MKNKKKGASLRVIYNKNDSEIDQTSSDWYQSLIHATDIDRGYHSASRNNALMTLALANYASGRSIEDAYDELDQFNSNLSHPLNKNEFEKTLNSAYSGKYKGVKRSYVEGLLEIWTDGQANFLEEKDGTSLKNLVKNEYVPIIKNGKKIS